MCMGGGSTPAAPPPVAPVPEAPTATSSAVQGASSDARMRAMAAAGVGSTILTGTQGLAGQAPNGAGLKTLLGS